MQAPRLIAVLRGPDHVVGLAQSAGVPDLGAPEEHLLDRSLFDVLPELREQVFSSRWTACIRAGCSTVGKETPATFHRKDGVEVECVYLNFV